MPGWNEAKTLTDKMDLAIEGATRADERASLPARTNRPKLYQHPNKNHHVTYPVHIPTVKPVAIPVPMEIDAVQTRFTDKKSPFSAIRAACIKKGLCFKCIQPFDAETHMVNGERKCPNKNASLSEKLALITNSEKNLTVSKTHQIAAVSFEVQVEAEDRVAFEELGEEERAAVDWLMENYCSGLSSPVYPHHSDLIDEPRICAVRLEADKSTPRRVNVAMTLREGDIAIPVVVLADTGSMTNVLDEKFAQKHGMTLIKKDIPLTCTGYDGKRGEDVGFEWRGKVRVFGSDRKTEDFDVVLNVTKLGNHEAIIGLPWMEEVGCSFVLWKEGSYLTLGKQLIVTFFDEEVVSDTLICEIGLSPFLSNNSSLHSSDSSFISNMNRHSSTITNPIIIPNSSDQIDLDTRNPFSVSEVIPKQHLTPELTRICAKYSRIFSLQDSVLPPHQSFDIAIELKSGCEAPFGGLYNLALSEQIELKAYLNDLLRKGFIRPSKSAAAAPIFFAKVPGKKNRPCVDYRGLNKVTKRDSYPIPVMSWLLNQLKGCKKFAKIDLKAAFNLLRVA